MEFTVRALRLQHEAIRLSQQMCGDNAEINRWMSVAKKHGMTWAGGLAFANENIENGVGPAVFRSS
jgi:hypothetical protein